MANEARRARTNERVLMTPTATYFLSASKGWKNTPLIPHPIAGKINRGISEEEIRTSSEVNFPPLKSRFMVNGPTRATPSAITIDIPIEIIFALLTARIAF